MIEPSESLERLVETAKQGVEANCANFEEPDDDFMPVLLIGQADGLVTIVGLDGEFLNGQGQKDVLAHVLIPAACIEFNAVATAFVSSAWVVERPADEIDARGFSNVIPSEHPDRKEAINLVALTLEKMVQSTAEIVRSPTLPPIIGPWKQYPYTVPGEGAGRMVEGMLEGLRAAQQVRQTE